LSQKIIGLSRYACGGYDGSQFLRSVEKYNPETDEWVSVASMNVKRSRVALVANCSKLYAVGWCHFYIKNLSDKNLKTGALENAKTPQAATMGSVTCRRWKSTTPPTRCGDSERR